MAQVANDLIDKRIAAPLSEGCSAYCANPDAYIEH